VTTKAHNALEINGQGQPKTETATGKVIVFKPGDEYDYVVGDATPAYGAEVERYRRHLLFLKPGVLVMLDEVQGREPISLKSWLHARAPFSIDQSTGRITLTFERARLAGFLHSPGGLEIAQMDEYSFPPELGTPPPEWHLTAQTKQKNEAARIVAVFGIARVGENPDLTDVNEASDEQTVALQFRHAGRLVKLLFDLQIPAVRVT
jgi:hypothetical protein